MTMEWPEKHNTKLSVTDDPSISVHCDGYNKGIDAIRKALNEACSREELAEIIRKVCVEYEQHNDPIMPLWFRITYEIIQYLRIEEKQPLGNPDKGYGGMVNCIDHRRQDHGE